MGDDFCSPAPPLTLEQAGFIKRQPRVARSIEPLVDPGQLPELL